MPKSIANIPSLDGYFGSYYSFLNSATSIIGITNYSNWVKNNIIIPSMLFEVVAVDTTNIREIDFTDNIAVLAQSFRWGKIVPSIVHIVIDYC